MALKVFIKSLNDVDETLRGYYTASEGGFVLDTDDGEYKNKINEFRTNNIELKQKLEGFAGIDADRYKQLQTEADELRTKLAEAQKNGGNEDVEKLRTEYEDRLKQALDAKENAEKQTGTYKGKLNDLLINDTIAKAVSNVGKVQKGALTDILHRARSIWEVNENGVPVAMKDGAAIYGSDGKLPLTAEEYAQSLYEEAPYLFEGNSGGGAGGSGGSGGSGGAVKTITRAEYQTGKYIDAVAKGEIAVVD